MDVSADSGSWEARMASRAGARREEREERERREWVERWVRDDERDYAKTHEWLAHVTLAQATASRLHRHRPACACLGGPLCCLRQVRYEREFADVAGRLAGDLRELLTHRVEP